MSGQPFSTITVEAGDAPAVAGAAIRKAASAAGLSCLPAARLALAATYLVGRPCEAVVVALAVVAAEDGPRVEAAVRRGTAGGAGLPVGLVDTWFTRTAGTGEVEQVVSVGVDGAQPPADPVLDALQESIDHELDPTALLGAALAAVQRRSRQLADGVAEVCALRAELDETNRGLLAIHGELHAANQRIADLLAMLSHDIRQPLGVIGAYTSTLLDEWDCLDDAQRRRDIFRVADAGAAMNQLVEEILTLTQVDAAGLSARTAHLEVRRALVEAIAGVCGAEPDTVTVLDGPPAWVLADPRHFQQIIANLVSNGLKYGAPPVEITVSWSDAIEIDVRDHGAGIPLDFVPHLFQRFSRADTPTSRAKRGTGLGLYIVRQLVEVNRGAVSYRNHPAGGGCFTVRLPAAQPAS